MSDAGGTAWEQGAAVTRMVEAMRVGDADEMALALADYAASLGTRVTASMSTIAAALFEELQSMRDGRKEETASNEHRIGMMLDQFEIEQAELGRHAAQIGVLEITALAFALAKPERVAHRALTKTIPALATQIADLTARVKALEGKVV